MSASLCCLSCMAFSALVLERLCPSGAVQIRPRGQEPVDFGICDQEALAAARRMIGQQRYRALIGHPCVTREDVQALIDGTRDPEDTYEILGRQEANYTVLPVDQRPSLPAYEPKPGDRPLLPKVLYLGLEHTGSTSLAMQLNMHPELSFGQMKEHKIFQFYNGQSLAAFREIYGKTFLVDTSEVKVTFDGSPTTFIFGYPGDVQMGNEPLASYFQMGAPAVNFVKDLVGHDVKLICMIRDPVDWMLSMAKKVSPTERTSIDFLLGDRNEKLANHSCYADALETWMQVFPRKSFLFLKSEEYFHDPQQSLDRIFDFVGVAKYQYEDDDFVPHGRRRNTVKASAKTRQQYFQNEHVRECKQRLSRLTRMDWTWSGA